MDREIRSFRVELRSDESQSRKLVGHAAVFDSPSCELYDKYLGSFTEVVKPGAFSNSLRENRDIKALFNHETGQSTLGRTGVNLMLREDEVGLYFELDIPETTAGNDLIVLVRTGIVTQCSFGFNVVKDNWVNRGDDQSPLRELLDVDLGEISVGVTNPAYEATSVSLRHAPSWVHDRIDKANEGWIEGFVGLLMEIDI